MMFNELINYILGAGFNLLVTLLIIRVNYYPLTRDKNYVFTYLAFNTTIYFVLGLLTSADLTVGVAFGLFAIFSILRYRTDTMPIREMTYLFIVIALPVMNSILSSSGDSMRLLIANGAIIILLYVLEKEWGFHFEASKKIVYEKLELITPANRDRLLADLGERTGLPIRRAEVGRIDFMSNTAEVIIYYKDPQTVAKANYQQTLERELQSGL
jgi:hypothetical protein